MEFKAGDLINRKWRLENIVGEGTSGTVFLSWDELQERKGAIKIYKDRKETFDRERILQTRLKVPHVVEIYEVNFTDDSKEFPYKAEQFVDGSNLDRWAEGKSLEEKLSILVQIAEGLEGIHEKNVTHNDVKPANIVIDKNDYVWLVDFGISRSDSLVWDKIRGAKSYAPPEKFDDPKHIDEKVDVYAFGAMAYELLTGQMPFTAGSIEELIKKIKQDVPKNPKQLNPEISEDLSKLIMKCLEKRPGDRFRDGKELFWHLDGAVNKRIGYVIGKIREEGILKKRRIQDLLIGMARKDEKVIVEGKIPPGQYPYGIQKGRTDFSLTDARYWTAPFWPGKLWIDYEVAGEERFGQWAEKWTRDLDVAIDGNFKRFELNILGCRAYYGYVPAFEITKDKFYLEKIKEIVGKMVNGFDEKFGFIQVDGENENWLYTFSMESCVPLLAWGCKYFDDEKLKKILYSHVKKSVELLMREDGSVMEIAEIKGNNLVREINPSGSGYRSREATRMLYGLIFVQGFDEKKERGRRFFWDNLPEDLIAFYDIKNQPTRDSSSSALGDYVLGKMGSKEDELKIQQALILYCLSRDGNYSGHLLNSCGNVNQAGFVDCSTISADYYFQKNLKERKN